MRDKFSELVAAGVAEFKYTPTAPETPNVCPICRAYNNIFALPTDTHMCCVDDVHYITGSALRKNWENIFHGYGLGNIQFIATGYYSISDFLYRNGLRYQEICTLNGDVALACRAYEPTSVRPEACCTCDDSNMPCAIPVKVKEHFVSGDPKTICESLNNQKLGSWCWDGKSFVGNLDGHVYVIESKEL